jgi:enoyl-CoA hydratase
VGEFVRLEVEDGVATLRLDRPKMNAIDGALRAELRAAAVEARDRDDVRAVVLYGGERVFAAGADIKEMSTMSYAEMTSWGTQLQEALTVVARLPKPVVAAVTGYALGGGFELALTADFRVLGGARQGGVPEIQLGVIPGAGGTQRLTRLVGPAKAKSMVFTGRHVGAEEALALGIATRSCRTLTSTPRPARWRRRTPRVPLSPCVRPSRPSTTVSSSTSTRHCGSRAPCSRACSPPRTRRPA